MRLVPLLVLLLACAARKPDLPSEYAVLVDEGGPARGSRSHAPPAPPPPPPVALAPGEAAMAPAVGATVPAVEAPDRKVHYDGFARLRVADPPETLDAVAALAEEAGGRTERLAGNTVSVRVPVEAFDAVWDQVLDLGELLTQSVRADDVTDQLTAVDLRVRTLRATQTRLVQLLGRAQDEHEKLALLQEITRVTEQLDALETQLRTLADLAAMSRISVEAVPREAFTGGGGGPELAGFEWVRALSPFNRGTWADDRRVPLDVPEGLVALSPRGPFVAESADGVVLWTKRVDNDPVGTADFWVDTIEDRLGEEFEDPERESIGRWECLTLREPGADEPYAWQICVADHGRWLHVAEAYFPGPEQVERFGAAVDASLQAGGES